MIAKIVVCGLDKTYLRDFKKPKKLTAHGRLLFFAILILALMNF